MGLATLLGCSAGAPSYVARDGAGFTEDGKPFRFVGFNLYDAAANDAYSCSPRTRLTDDELDQAMTTIKDSGGTVVRFWAYQTYTAGGTDWSGIDRVIDAARDQGLRVLPVLEDGPGDCSTGPAGVPLAEADRGRWFSEGYTKPLGWARVSYRDYAERIARHYRDQPTILAWMMVNEAETEERDDQGRSQLVDFAEDIASVLHAADPHHLVTLGTQSNGAPGASGPDFTAVYRLPGLDFSEVHDWATRGADDQPMPGAEADGSLPAADSEACRALDAPIACSFAINPGLGKPLVVGEAGIAADDTAGRARRAQQLGAKMQADFTAGADGYLVWQLNTANTDGFGVLMNSDDPAFSALRRQAGRIG